MSKPKEKRATDQLNVALSGVHAALFLLADDAIAADKTKRLHAIETARNCIEEAEKHVLTIRQAIAIL